MVGLLFLTVFLLLANGFFVAAEFALVKVRSTQLDVRAETGSRTALLARSLLDHLDGYLSATQLGITLTSLGLGWIGEPAVAAVMHPLFALAEVNEELSHKIALVVGFSLISFLHIVVGEVAPKSLAIARPVSVSMAVAGPMRAFYIVFYPALVVLNAASNALLRLVGVEPAGTHSLAMPADELARVAAESAAEGHISAGQGEMMSNIFAFSHRVAREIMIPRTRIEGIDVSRPLPEQIAEALDTGHSRRPVYDGKLDKLLGVLHIKDLLRHRLDTLTDADVRVLARPPLLVPETLPAEKLMRTMQRKRTHLAIVIDEHGGVCGIVTLEDALEELVGDIQDEYDQERDTLTRRDEGGFAMTGAVLLNELCPALGVATPDSDADTLQGWLMEELERLPRAGDELRLGRWMIRVLEVHARAVTHAEATEAPESDE
jgi:CBS domain containing-hemolysin-like protein